MSATPDSLIEGDCLEVLPDLPDASVDMVLCDLPYGTTQNKWDSAIPLERLWAEYRRVLKPRGVIALTSQGLFTARLMLSNESWFRYKFVWIKSKPTNFLNARRQPLRQHEDICVFYGPAAGVPAGHVAGRAVRQRSSQGPVHRQLRRLQARAGEEQQRAAVPDRCPLLQDRRK